MVVERQTEPPNITGDHLVAYSMETIKMHYLYHLPTKSDYKLICPVSRGIGH